MAKAEECSSDDGSSSGLGSCNQPEQPVKDSKDSESIKRKYYDLQIIYHLIKTFTIFLT